MVSVNLNHSQHIQLIEMYVLSVFLGIYGSDSQLISAYHSTSQQFSAMPNNVQNYSVKLLTLCKQLAWNFQVPKFILVNWVAELEIDIKTNRFIFKKSSFLPIRMHTQTHLAPVSWNHHFLNCQKSKILKKILWSYCVCQGQLGLMIGHKKEAERLT